MIKKTIKKIQFTSGCPNNCNYCYELKEMRYYTPKIPMDQPFQILDMNLLSNPNALTIIAQCGLNKYPKELVCGVDFRLLNQDICNLLKQNNFIKIRWAWDYSFASGQRTHQKVWRMFKKAGYRSEDLSVFILANWKIPYSDCIKKLDLLKVWNVKVNDCCFDGGYKKAKPKDWDIDQIKRFRKMCRKHNQMVRFKIDPELK